MDMATRDNFSIDLKMHSMGHPLGQATLDAQIERRWKRGICGFPLLAKGA